MNLYCAACIAYDPGIAPPVRAVTLIDGTALCKKHARDFVKEEHPPRVGLASWVRRMYREGVQMREPWKNLKKGK